MQDLLSHPAILWLIVAILSVIIEMLLPHFGVLFIAISAALVSVISSFTTELPLYAQLLLFSVTLMFGLAFLRPRFVRKALQAKGIPHRVEALLGKRGVVTAVSRADFDEEDWGIESDEALQTGDAVMVTGADGIILKVKKIKE